MLFQQNYRETRHAGRRINRCATLKVSDIIAQGSLLDFILAPFKGNHLFIVSADEVIDRFA
jgi:hypothetical protein